MEPDILGESPVWDHRIGALYWVDQLKCKVRRHRPADGRTEQWTLPGPVGCVALTSDVGIVLAALPDTVVLLDVRDGTFRTFVSLPMPRPGIRLNDGRCDRFGRFVVGSVTTDDGEAGGSIWRIGTDGVAERLDQGLRTVNSICFDPAGDCFYFADSRRGILQVRDYGIDRIGAEKDLVDTRPLGGAPDGSTVDADGGVWTAMIRPGKIARFLRDGQLDRLIDLPVPHVSSLTFGGDNLDVLYVTSVRRTGITIETSHPEAGKLFAIRGLGLRGVEEGIFALGSRS